MKKAILCAAALMFGTMAFAQVSGTPFNGDVVPTATLVPALPGAPATANTGLSIQNGDDNKVRVRQAGTSQSVYSFQENGAGVGGNLARVMQTGAVQAASGVENATDVLQSGSYNQSTTVQEGDYNNATTRQGQKEDGANFNRAKIRQGTGQQAEGNHAVIDQDGFFNQASTLQIYDNSDAWTIQEGNENKSMIVQDAGPNGSDGHEALVEQYGLRNESSVNQSSAGARNIATALQQGDDNAAKQLQTSHAGSGMTGNRAGLMQGLADYDYSRISLVDDFLGDIYGNTIDANADDIYGSIVPFSLGAVAFQIQNGKENEADMLQFGGSVGASNYGEQVQASGWGNEAAMAQGHYYTGESSNYGKQYQAGDNNEADLGQSGSGMKASQSQIGHRNDAWSNQRGENHLLNVNQRGNDNAATTVQAGSANVALLTQRGGQSYSIEQNMDLGQFDRSAGANQADILQLGPSGDFNADYIDCDFDDPMDPTMDYTVPGFDLGDVCPDC